MPEIILSPYTCPVCGSNYGDGHGQSCRTSESLHLRIEALENLPRPAETVVSQKMILADVEAPE